MVVSKNDRHRTEEKGKARGLTRRQQKGEAGQDVQVRSWQAKASGSELRAREMGWLRRREFLRDMEVGMAAFGQGSGGWGVDVGGVREVGYTSIILKRVEKKKYIFFI